MKKLIKNSTLLLTLLLFDTQLYAATSRSDVKILEASEDIKFISQQMIKDYLYLSQNKQKKNTLVSSLNKMVVTLEKKLRLIASATKSEDTKNILTFLAFNSEQIGETITKPYSKENAALMLDYSETLLEGTESIAHEHSYQFSKEEQMLINVKNMAYLIERITKYYMAFQAGFTDLNNVRQLKLAVSSFDKELENLHLYGYRNSSAEDLETINHYWKSVRTLYLTLEKRKLPNILYLSAEHLENVIVKLELYHSKNQ